MTKMWMVRGDGGCMYEGFRERGVVAVSWPTLAAYAKPGVAREDLIALYQSHRVSRERQEQVHRNFGVSSMKLQLAIGW